MYNCTCIHLRVGADTEVVGAFRNLKYHIKIYGPMLP